LPIVVVAALVVGPIGRGTAAVDGATAAACAIDASDVRVEVLGLAEGHRTPTQGPQRATPWLRNVWPSRMVAPGPVMDGRREGPWPTVARRRLHDPARSDDPDPLS
jgi:hypothetical protein